MKDKSRKREEASRAKKYGREKLCVSHHEFQAAGNPV
jgi:hypothetical protein